jgi:hypothetical protein
MAKPFAVCALRIISAATGAAVNHYLAKVFQLAGTHLEQAVSPKAAVAAPPELNVEVVVIGLGATFDTKN